MQALEKKTLSKRAAELAALGHAHDLYSYLIILSGPSGQFVHTNLNQSEIITQSMTAAALTKLKK